ncbi:MAG: hypothetical protein U1F43_00190 [Myxococcota bacterium]
MSRLLRRVLPDRPGPMLAALILMGGAGLALALFVPGFDSPGYYSALSLALLGGLVAGPVGVVAGRRALDAGKNPFTAALKAILPAAFAPLVLLLLNGFRVVQCDIWSGVFFYLLGPPLTCAFAAVVGAGCAAVTRPKKLAIPLYYLVWLTWVALELVHLYRQPAIFAYNPFGGFFSGAVYDTVIEIDSRIVLYRLNNLAQALFVVTLVRLGWDRIEGRLTFAAMSHASMRRWIAWLSTAAVCLVFWSARGSIGYEIDRERIQHDLGGVISGPRLVLYYDEEHIPRPAKALYEDHVFRLDQLAATLGPYPERVTSYVYGTTDQKRRLMGAGQTYIAKPWLREIHLNRVPYGGAAVIRHELAHVVLGVFAPAPLHIPTADYIPVPQMALVEGAAEAFEWDTGQLSSHEWACAMRQAKLAPPLEDLLEADSFYKQSGDKAYRCPAASSAGRHRHGADALRARLSTAWRLRASTRRRCRASSPTGAPSSMASRCPTTRPVLPPAATTDPGLPSAVRPRRRAGSPTHEARLGRRSRGRDGGLSAGHRLDPQGPAEAHAAPPAGGLPATISRRPRRSSPTLAPKGGTRCRTRRPSSSWPTPTGAPATSPTPPRCMLRSWPRRPTRTATRNILVKAWVAADPHFQVIGSYLLDGQLATLDKVRQALPDDPLVDYLVLVAGRRDHKNVEAIPLLEASTRDLRPTRSRRGFRGFAARPGASSATRASTSIATPRRATPSPPSPR